MPILTDQSTPDPHTEAPNVILGPALILGAIVTEIADAWRGQSHADQISLAVMDAFVLALSIAMEAPEYAAVIHAAGLHSLGGTNSLAHDLIRQNARRTIERFPVRAIILPVQGASGEHPPSGGGWGTERVPQVQEEHR